MTHSFDVRRPLGVLFVVFGAILVLEGAVGRIQVTGINVDLWWGGALAGFGAVMLALAARARARAHRTNQRPGAQSP